VGVSRGLVMGVSWYDEEGDRRERVLVAADPHVNVHETRKAMDHLLGVVPLEFRPDVAQFFSPFLEKNEPARPGTYDQVRYCEQPVIMWWKWAFVASGAGA
jgi:hypothetical protein